MCLCTNGRAKVKIAEEDLTFYKVLRKGVDERLYTPYTVTEVGLYLPYKEKSERFIRDKRNLDNEFSAYGKGMYHLCETYEDAARFARMCYHPTYKPIIVKAIVPKGTKYIEGRTEGGMHTIGAKAVRYEELKVEEKSALEEHFDNLRRDLKNVLEMVNALRKRRKK